MTHAASHYTHSPATRLVATHCACCGQPLLDAVSAELGIGPVCRRKHGFTVPDAHADWAGCDAALLGTPALAKVQSEMCHPRLAANYLVFCIAMAPESDEAQRYVAALYRLGFRELAARIAMRIRGVVVSHEGDELVMKAPFNPRFPASVRLAGWRGQYDRKTKCWRGEVNAVALWKAIQNGFLKGTVVIGGKGATLL